MDLNRERPVVCPRLPAELIRAVFSSPPLLSSDEDRLRCHAVCKSWRSALLELPFPRLVIDEGTQLSKCLWVIETRPTFEVVEVEGEPHSLLPAMLRTLSREALRELYFFGSVSKALPSPIFFPNLNSLMLRFEDMFFEFQHWLPQLSALPHLRALDLTVWHDNEQAAASVILPPLAGLTSLAICVNELPVSIPLRDLPSIQALRLEGDGLLDLTAGIDTGSRASQLTGLWCEGNRVTAVDFAAMPALASLLLRSKDVTGTETIASTVALTRLDLGRNGDEEVQPWVAQLLRHAPSSLRALNLWGLWSPGLAATVSGLGQLQVLTLESKAEVRPLPPPGAALWGSLRALRLDHCNHIDSPPMPEGLHCASRLERLCFRSKALSAIDLYRLLDLPALRHLTIEGPTGEAAAAAARVAKATLPQVKVVVYYYCCGAQQFLDAALHAAQQAGGA